MLMLLFFILLLNIFFLILELFIYFFIILKFLFFLIVSFLKGYTILSYSCFFEKILPFLNKKSMNPITSSLMSMKKGMGFLYNFLFKIYSPKMGVSLIIQFMKDLTLPKGFDSKVSGVFNITLYLIYLLIIYLLVFLMSLDEGQKFFEIFWVITLLVVDTFSAFFLIFKVLGDKVSFIEYLKNLKCFMFFFSCLDMSFFKLEFEKVVGLMSLDMDNSIYLYISYTIFIIFVFVLDFIVMKLFSALMSLCSSYFSYFEDLFINKLGSPGVIFDFFILLMFFNCCFGIWILMGMVSLVFCLSFYLLSFVWVSCFILIISGLGNNLVYFYLVMLTVWSLILFPIFFYLEGQSLKIKSELEELKISYQEDDAMGDGVETMEGLDYNNKDYEIKMLSESVKSLLVELEQLKEKVSDNN